MRKFIAALAAVPLWACQTPVGVPCFTLTYQHSVWALVKWPVKDLVTAEVAGTMAVHQDGSVEHRIKPTSRFAIRDRQESAPSDFRHPALFYLENAYRRSKGGDDGCRGVVAAFGNSLERAGASSMLGEPVVNWKFKTTYGDATALLAPGLDCQVLRMESIEYRYRYFPVRKELFEAKTLRRE